MGAVSYSPSIVTMALSCINSEIKRDIGQKSWFFFIFPLAFDAPGILPSRLVRKNWNGGATRRWKNVEDMCNHLHSIPACDRRTDRQTDGQTDILPRHSPRYAYASRGNKIMYHMTWLQCVAFNHHVQIARTYLLAGVEQRRGALQFERITPNMTNVAKLTKPRRRQYDPHHSGQQCVTSYPAHRLR